MCLVINKIKIKLAEAYYVIRAVNKETGEERRIISGLKKKFHPTRVLDKPFQVKYIFIEYRLIFINTNYKLFNKIIFL